jgi:hypothetical protein
VNVVLGLFRYAFLGLIVLFVFYIVYLIRRDME